MVNILLDSRRYSKSAKALGKIILQDLKAASAEIDNRIPKQKRRPFNVIVDEFSDLAQPEFLEFLDRARSSKMGTIVAHQELSDLKKVSDEFYVRLLTLTSTHFIFQTKHPESAEILAGTIGTRKTVSVTERVSSIGFGFKVKTGEASARETEEFMIHPNTFKNLTVGECVYATKYPQADSGIVHCKKENIDYLKDEELTKLYAPTKTTKLMTITSAEVEISKLNNACDSYF